MSVDTTRKRADALQPGDRIIGLTGEGLAVVETVRAVTVDRRDRGGGPAPAPAPARIVHVAAYRHADDAESTWAARPSAMIEVAT